MKVESQGSNECNESVINDSLFSKYEEMESDLRSKISLPNSESLETMNDNIARLKWKIRDKIVLMLRSKIGDIKGLSGLQIYMKFKSVVMSLDKSFRPEESSWPVFLLEIFTPHSVNWPE